MIQPVENCISYVEGELFHSKFLMSPSTQELMESILKHLKKLKDCEAQLALKVEAPKVVDEKSSH